MFGSKQRREAKVRESQAARERGVSLAKLHIALAEACPEAMAYAPYRESLTTFVVNDFEEKSLGEHPDFKRAWAEALVERAGPWFS